MVKIEQTGRTWAETQEVMQDQGYDLATQYPSSIYPIKEPVYLFSYSSHLRPDSYEALDSAGRKLGLFKRRANRIGPRSASR